MYHVSLSHCYVCTFANSSLEFTFPSSLCTFVLYVLYVRRIRCLGNDKNPIRCLWLSHETVKTPQSIDWTVRPSILLHTYACQRSERLQRSCRSRFFWFSHFCREALVILYRYWLVSLNLPISASSHLIDYYSACRACSGFMRSSYKAIIARHC